MSLPVDRFIESLVTTSILSAAEARALSDSIPAEKHASDSDELARELVKQGKLTRFQAAAIYQQKADGLLLGNYLILDKLGAGGMGQVFRARHRRMDRIVALKLLPKKSLNSPDAVARFQREVKAAARLTHPNIVTAFDADESNGLHFLVMEYVEGSDLSGLVRHHGPLAVVQALDYIRQAARGLSHAHSENIVHRDIKPSNLLLDKRGMVKILDMGLARVSDPLADPNADPGSDLTHSGSIMGSIDYMAPEQAMDSRQADARADIYSLGCTLHFLLAARPPYGGDTVLKRLTAHQQAAIPMLSALRPEIPPALQEVFQRMLAKRAAQRYPSVAELLADLDALARDHDAQLPAMPHPLTLAPQVHEAGSRHLGELDSIVLPGRKHRQAVAAAPAATPLGNKRLIISAAAAALVMVVIAVAWILKGSGPTELAIADPPARVIPRPVVKAAPPERPRTAASSAATVAASPPTAPPAIPKASVPAASAIPTVTESPTAATREESEKKPAAMPPASQPLPAATAATAVSMVAAAGPPAAVAGAPPPADEGPWPVPSATAQQAAAEVLKDAYKNEFAEARQGEAKVALAQKLIEESRQAHDDRVGYYVILWAARELAVEASNPAVVEQAIDLLAEKYAIKPLRELASALEQMAARARSVDVHQAIAKAALGKVDRATAETVFDVAKRFTDVAIAEARKAKDPSLTRQAVDAGKVVSVGRQQWSAWRKAETVLEKTPDDAEANYTVGYYLLVVRGEWQEGIEHLARGPAGTIKDLASQSLSASTEPEQTAALGDAWWNAIDKGKTKEKPVLRFGAAYCYSQALPGLTSLVKTKIEKRMVDLADVVVARQKQQLAVAAAHAPPPAVAPFDAQQARQHQYRWAAAVDAPVEITNPIGLTLTLIPAGEFRMGSSPAQMELAHQVGEQANLKPDAWEYQLAKDEVPEHVVGISQPFWIGTTEVTIGQYRQFVEAAGYTTETEKLGGGYLTTDKATNKRVWTPERSWRAPGYEVTDGSPATQLTWSDCVAFCNWLSDQEKLERCYRLEGGDGQWAMVPGVLGAPAAGSTSPEPADRPWSVPARFGYRLPTEAEWEYACRAGTQALFSFGDDAKSMEQYAWFRSNSGSHAGTVAAKLPNPFGLFDMHGNVQEWCFDWLATKYYADSPKTDPCNRSGDYSRVFRGGAYGNSAIACRSAYRDRMGPKERRGHVGFRVVRCTAGIPGTGRSQLALDGQRSCIQVPGWQYTGDTPLTVEGWLTYAHDETTARRSEDIMADREAGGWFIDRYCGDQGGRLRTGFGVHDGKGYLAVREKTPVDIGRLVHVAGTFDGKSEIRLYVDGREQQRATLRGPFKRSSLPALVGANPSNASYSDCFAGTIRELRVSSVLRYQRDFIPERRFSSDADTIVLFHLDEGRGEVARDSSGHGRHGKILAAKWLGGAVPTVAAVRTAAAKISPASTAKLATTKPSSNKPVARSGSGLSPAVAPFAPEEARQFQQRWGASLKTGVVRPNALGTKMMLIPPGEFLMGGSTAQIEHSLEGISQAKEGWYVDVLRASLPQHPVRLTNPFWIAATETTVGQFRRFVEATGYQAESQRDGKGGSVYVGSAHKQGLEFGWQTPGYQAEDDFPVTELTWNDAVMFCNWLSSLERLPPVYVEAASGWQVVPGPGYRLPTEAEWEFAARAGTTAIYFWGDHRETSATYCWSSGNSKGSPRVVGTKEANAFGLFDMAGNAREWLQDYGGTVAIEGQLAVDPLGPPTGTNHVYRGGRWNHSVPPSFERSVAPPGYRASYTGFRVARSIP